MSDTPNVSVILPCRNEAEHIGPCLRSILGQDHPQGGFEVIVADGMSTDGTRDILAMMALQEPRIRVVDNPAQFTPHGLNAAIRAAKGPIIIRMDAHTRYARDYIIQCVAVLDEAKADNVGGPWVAQGAGWVSRAISAAFQSPFAVGGARSHKETFEGPVDSVYLGCWPRKTFATYGLFDEDFVRNQDDEHNLRITRSGGRIWQSPRIKSWYTPRGSLAALFHQYYQYGYWKVRVIRKHGAPASFRHLVPGLFITTLIACAAGAPFGAAFRWAGAASLLGYGGMLLVASLYSAASAGWPGMLLLPAIFAAYHFGYGIGFLHGAFDALVLGRKPHARATALTRKRGK
jgi:glycosyltransferase involved in cell wall biosynthesis